MKKGAWNQMRLLLEQRARLYLERPSDFAQKIKEMDKAILEEESRHRLAVKNFKMSRKTWRKAHKSNKKYSAG